jgi:hypothetical protein
MKTKKNVFEIWTLLVGLVSGLSSVFFVTLADGGSLLSAGGICTLAFAVGAVAYANIPVEVLANIRRWHGTIDDQFNDSKIELPAKSPGQKVETCGQHGCAAL